MPVNSDWPVKDPIITGVLLDAIHEENQAEGRRPKAADTVTRYSDAGKCARAIAFDAMGIEPSDPADLAGEWVMWLGRLLHEEMQKAILDTFPGAVVEATSQLGDTVSGHADAVVKDPEMGRILYELKTTGAFRFDLATGIQRPRKGQPPSRRQPQGPPSSAKLQGALNAVAHDCDWLVIGMISMESVSIGVAESLQLSMQDRMMAEWHYDRAEFAPWAERELERMELIAQHITEGVLPPTIAVGDEMELVKLNPHDYRRPWQCQYCPHTTTCLSID